MIRTTGVHSHGRDLRLVTLEARDDGKTAACARVERRLSCGPEVLVSEQDPEPFVSGLSQSLAEADAAGAIAFALPGGWFHIQKVPLEVASADDRRSQMVWEAAQGLAANPRDLVISYIPAGRSAFWVASRTGVCQRISDAFRAAGAEAVRLVPEPVALACACNPDRGRTTAVYLRPPWVSFCSTRDGVLVSAESATTDGRVAHGDRKTSNPGAQGDRSAAELVRRWLAGDLKSSRRRPGHSRLLVCGDHQCAGRMVLEAGTYGLPVEYLAPFRECGLSDAAANHPTSEQRQSDFAVATGLAFSGLSRDEIP